LASLFLSVSLSNQSSISESWSSIKSSLFLIFQVDLSSITASICYIGISVFVSISLSSVFEFGMLIFNYIFILFVFVRFIRIFVFNYVSRFNYIGVFVVVSFTLVSVFDLEFWYSITFIIFVLVSFSRSCLSFRYVGIFVFFSFSLRLVLDFGIFVFNKTLVILILPFICRSYMIYC